MSQEHAVNPFNGKPYSQKYRDIMKKRKDLPVFQQMGERTVKSSSQYAKLTCACSASQDEFFQIFNKNQMTVMVGETGSGKTTQ